MLDWFLIEIANDASSFEIALSLIAHASILMFIQMTLLWVWARMIKNYAVVDVAWSLSFSWVALCCYLDTPEQTHLMTFMLFLVSSWSIGLGAHLYFNRIKNKPEEGRYKTLRKSWSDHLHLKFFIFYQLQGISVIFLSMPFILVMSDKNVSFGLTHVVATLIIIGAIASERIADHQLTKFQTNPENKGKVCTTGLWAWSRHPNYFFEWLIWIGFAFFAISSDYGPLALISPLAIQITIFYITGIPPTEEQCLKSKGKAYERYQQTTSAFFPMPPKSKSITES